MNSENSFSINIFKRIMRKVSPFVYGVSITGGEPMLYPKLVDDVAMIVTDIMGTNIELDLVTNGTNWDEIPQLKMIDRFESVHISRHRIDDEGNAVLRSKILWRLFSFGGNYEIVIQKDSTFYHTGRNNTGRSHSLS